MINGTLIITAAGKGTRFGSINKCLQLIDDKTVLEKTIDQFIGFNWNEIIITCNNESRLSYEQIIEAYEKKITLIIGGETRFESVKNAVLTSKSTSDYVVIHDAARPFCSKDLIQSIINNCHEYAVIPGVSVVDTIKEVSANGLVKNTPERSTLKAIQTPQKFKKECLINCYNHDYTIEITDEAMLFELNNLEIKVVDGEKTNKKITYKSDLN